LTTEGLHDLQLVDSQAASDLWLGWIILEETMRLSPHLNPTLVITDLEATSSEHALELVVDMLRTALPDMDHEVLLDRLLTRDRQGSCGLEFGVSVPHATLEGHKKTTVLIARLASGVDCKARDGIPARLMFVMISPPDAIATHLRLLARIARLCSRQEFIDALLQAADAKALFELVRREDERHV
jgi:PTS system nitrogen regulatory IIA component